MAITNPCRRRTMVQRCAPPSPSPDSIRKVSALHVAPGPPPPCALKRAVILFRIGPSAGCCFTVQVQPCSFRPSRGNLPDQVRCGMATGYRT